MDGLSPGSVAYRFNVVPIRTNDKNCVVVCVVVRSQTRRTIVLSTRPQSWMIENFSFLAILDRRNDANCDAIVFIENR